MIADNFFSSSSSGAFFGSSTFSVAASVASPFSWFHGSLVLSSSVSIDANPAFPPGPLPSSMSSERGVRRNLFMIPEKLGKLIEAKRLVLVSVFFSSLLSARKEIRYEDSRLGSRMTQGNRSPFFSSLFEASIVGLSGFSGVAVSLFLANGFCNLSGTNLRFGAGSAILLSTSVTVVPFNVVSFRGISPCSGLFFFLSKNFRNLFLAGAIELDLSSTASSFSSSTVLSSASASASVDFFSSGKSFESILSVSTAGSSSNGS